MGEHKSKGGKRRWLIVWLAAALLVETGALLWFFAYSRQLRAELRNAHAADAPDGAQDSCAAGAATVSFIFRPATAAPSNTPTAACFAAPIAAAVPAEVEPRPWRYIIVHHSATASGSAQAFEAYHRARGMNNGLAYHFVVCNGTNNTDDGEVEIGARWVKQLAGGHCRQHSVNAQAIGICLVGDFTRCVPSDKQMKALAQLVFDLKRRFSIPDENILGHGDVAGEFSDCPGKSFPWETFRAALAAIAEAERAEKQAAFSNLPIAPPIRP